MPSNKDTARRHYELVWGGADEGAIATVVGRNYVGHAPGTPPLAGREGLRRFIADWRRGFPDLAVSIRGQIAEGDRVVTLLTLEGTHRGRFAGIAATGRRVSLPAMAMAQVREAEVSQEWLEWDRRSLLEQLDLVPELA